VAQKVGQTVGNAGIITYREGKIDLAKPWQRMTVTEAFDTFASISMDEALSRDRYDDVMAFEIEPRLGGIRPVFLYDYPACRGALARLKPGDHRFAERFELYIAGLELCNAFSELGDPDEQRQRFEKELADRNEAGKTVYPMPERFLKALDRMPTAAGCALGVDRLVMLFADTSSIDEVTAFVPEEL
jgi:lysyl-tRNA synthetase class 2